MTNEVEYSNQFKRVRSLSRSGIKDRLNNIVISVEGKLAEEQYFIGVIFVLIFQTSGLYSNMKTCSFLVTFSLAIVLVNAFSTEEHVKRFFRPEHRPLLPAITSLQLREDESYRAPAPLNDDSTKCLAHCEPECKKLQVPDFLTVNIIVLLFRFFQHAFILLNRY